MFNAIEAYSEAGHKAGKAQNERDASRVRFITDHFRRMLDYETGKDRDTARAAFDAAYRAARNVGTVS